MSSLPPIATTGSPNISAPTAISSPALKSDSGEKNLFVDLMSSANQDQLRSEQAVQDLVSGQRQDVQQVVMEVVKAEMSFQVFMEVRNQIVDSYNELMRMQF